MAVTVKARAKGLLRGARDLLGEKSLPKDVREALEKLDGALKKTWADLESEAGATTADASASADIAEALREAEGARVAGLAALRESANVGQYVEASIHRDFTMLADDWFGSGYLTREERIGLSAAIGAALDAFARKLAEVAPQLYERRPWEEAPGAGQLITFADITPAAAAGEAVQVEAAVAEIRGDVVPLLERALRADGTARVKIIQPGWGSTGYYSAAVLERDGPKVFTAGTHMYVDHPTATEQAERPERSLRELGGVLVSDAQYQNDPVEGPGLYADAKVFADFQPVLMETAPHIGVSINADGKVRPGEAEGRSGALVEQITGARSVDFVTKAGAGGKVMSLYESLRGRNAQVDKKVREAGGQSSGGNSGEGSMNEEEIRGLREAKEAAETESARLREALLLREARDVAATELAGMELPEPTRKRLTEALSKKPVIVDNKLDVEAFKAAVREAATAEIAYLAEATGAGTIVGMGSVGAGAVSTEEVEKSLSEAFRGLGLSESLAKRAAQGR